MSRARVVRGAADRGMPQRWRGGRLDGNGGDERPSAGPGAVVAAQRMHLRGTWGEHPMGCTRPGARNAVISPAAVYSDPPSVPINRVAEGVLERGKRSSSAADTPVGYAAGPGAVGRDRPGRGSASRGVVEFGAAANPDHPGNARSFPAGVSHTAVMLELAGVADIPRTVGWEQSAACTGVGQEVFFPPQGGSGRPRGVSAVRDREWRAVGGVGRAE